jgi:isopenicillin N synthase-like dioxygenase
VGDVIQVWSNDRYHSPLRRVCCQRGATRMSIPFFFNPKDSFSYAPLEGSSAEPARYRPINFGEFRRRRASGDYADLGEEVQIDQYRIEPEER